MAYEDMVRQCDNFCLDKAIEISHSLLPEQYRRAPWHILNHGVDLLSSELQLCAYMSAYGEMHKTKCLVVCQNINFDNIISDIEIIDWGCGQGLASMAIIDLLKEHDLYSQLRRVTLIEPSEAALNRARFNLGYISNGEQFEVIPLQQYLPSTEDDTMPNIRPQHYHVIHLFSNILDVPNINLKAVARKVATTGTHNIVLCMGPMNSNSWRIDQFCDYFKGEVETISNVNSKIFGYTSLTNHPFSCKTKGIVFFKSNILWDETAVIDAYTTNELTPYCDDYDFSILSDIFSSEVLDVFNRISNILTPSDKIFLRPDINGDSPDIVVIRRHIGISIILVGSNNDLEQLKARASFYKSNFVKLHIKELEEQSIQNSETLKLVSTAIVTSDSINTSPPNNDNGYTYILSIENINGNFFNDIRLRTYGVDFNDRLYRKAIKLINSQWHTYKEGLPNSNLTQNQKYLSESIVSKQKIKGVAGSGKTHVLAHRAVNAQLRTGGKVLILTYNLTLRSYIKHRISQVRRDFHWNKFVITNYHEFFKSQAANVGKPVHDISSFEDENYFHNVYNKTQRYDAIFIDEVQDYMPEWLTIIQRYFLVKENAEFVVFGDVAQNIFNRTLDDENNITVPGIRGRWIERLNRPIRFLDSKLTALAGSFAREFMGADQTINDGIIEGLEDSNFIKYANIPNDTRPETFARYCQLLAQSYGVVYDETIILGFQYNLLRDIMHEFKEQNTNIQTHATFETKTEFENIFRRVYHVEYCNYPISQGYNEPPMTEKMRSALKAVRRGRKLHFSMDEPGLKFSSVHSFKGWEAKNVILIIPPLYESCPDNVYAVNCNLISNELMYTALTRARKNLFIFNMGNVLYHEFFNTYIQ